MLTRNSRHSAASILAVLFIVTAFSRPAHALQYTDPGSSAMLIQIISALVVGFIFYFSVFKNWLVKKLNREEAPESGSIQESEPYETSTANKR